MRRITHKQTNEETNVSTCRVSVFVLRRSVLCSTWKRAFKICCCLNLFLPLSLSLAQITYYINVEISTAAAARTHKGSTNQTAVPAYHTTYIILGISSTNVRLFIRGDDDTFSQTSQLWSRGGIMWNVNAVCCTLSSIYCWCIGGLFVAHDQQHGTDLQIAQISVTNGRWQSFATTAVIRIQDTPTWILRVYDMHVQQQQYCCTCKCSRAYTRKWKDGYVTFIQQQ